MKLTQNLLATHEEVCGKLDTLLKVLALGSENGYFDFADVDVEPHVGDDSAIYLTSDSTLRLKSIGGSWKMTSLIFSDKVELLEHILKNANLEKLMPILMRGYFKHHCVSKEENVAKTNAIFDSYCIYDGTDKFAPSMTIVTNLASQHPSFNWVV